MQSYKRPPITEAVIEFISTDTYDEEMQRTVADRLRTRYPNQERQNDVQVQIDTSGGSPQIRNNVEPSGYRLSSDDRADLAIMSKKALATSRLAPYIGWDAFKELAVENWKVWRKVGGKGRITRIGVRYINRIDIPSGASPIDIRDYVNVFPAAPAFTDQPMDNYIVGMNRRLRDKSWKVNLSSAPVNPPPMLDHISLLLDIDVYIEGSVDASGEELWNLVDRARGHKNEIFEACITDKSRALFET